MPVLFFANKMDRPMAMTPVDCVANLELTNVISDRSWHIAASNALTGEGLEEGVTWLGQMMARCQSSAGKK